MATAPSTPPRRRRTQAERRAETRTALMEATIECLVTHGYAKTTTGRIADLAGVSRGAQIPYFRSRADLVSAALAQLARKRVEAVQARFGAGPVSLEEALDALWEEHRGPVFDATLELWVASRTDPELRARMLRIEREVTAAVAEVAGAALGELSRRPGFADDLVFAQATIRGLALLGVSSGAGSRALARHWAQARARLLDVLG